MADWILSPLMQILVERLTSPFIQDIQDRFHMKDNITKLQQSLPKVQALLEDAQEQQVKRPAVKQWLMKLEDAVFESELLLDKLTAERKALERLCKGGEVAGVRSLFPFNRIFLHGKIASDLQKKLGWLDQIAEQAFSFNLHEKEMNESSVRSRETMSCVLGNVYGREEDKQNILNYLLHNYGENKMKERQSTFVTSIVGIGGVGKTTLAQMVYNDDMVNLRFEMKLWIHVSEDFDLGKLMKSVIESATQGRYELCGLDNLQSKLCDLLTGKIFLLVLDDVWNEDKEKWRMFINLFKIGAEGSRVLLTTRSQCTASITKSTMYELKGLKYDESWKLFKEIAFRQSEDSADNRLIDIGKEIINKCGGIPLAVRALASILRSKKEEYWLSVQESELWQFKEYRDAVMPALKLSYQYLPSHLKRCLAFCSLFSKDHEIPREKMIHIWMAHDLISPDGGTRPLEVIGGEYFDDLLSLSFFQEVQKHDGSPTLVYKMHDLIHDLVTTVGGDGFAVLNHGLSSTNLERVHHLSVVCQFTFFSLPRGFFRASYLRTLLFLSPGGSSDTHTPAWPFLFINLKVLDLSGYGLKNVAEEIKSLWCLRYLDLSSNPIQKLPQTICDLYFLQTLNLFECQNLVELPNEIAALTNLRHLNIKGCEALSHMPAMVGELVQLQTLPIYIVGRLPEESIAQLQFLDLRNELSIKSMENIRDSEEAKKANMREKKHLKCLKLQWGSSSWTVESKPAMGASSSNPLISSHQREEEGDNVEFIMKQLEPHSNLKNLHVDGYPGRNFPSWKLPNLTMVELINCRRCHDLPKLGHLPFLERLHLQGMNSITSISQSFYGGVDEPFPSLKCLTIRDFPHLEEWLTIEGVVPFPRLEELVLDKCPNLTTAPAFPSIRHLELHHCSARIMKSMESANSLTNLIINELPDLEYLSGTFLQRNHHLKSLEIHSCQNLLLLPRETQNLTALKSLIITCCEKLRDLPSGLNKLKSLELLEINGCHSFKILPYKEIEGLQSLKTLSIENCSNLISFSGGFHNLIALEQLSIMSCPELTSLPDGFHNLSSFRSLNIVSCPRLAYLPVSLQHATKLQSLVIHSCSGLTDLPEWFGRFSSLRSLAILKCEKLKSLPEGLQLLTELQMLSIQDCPILEDLCKKKGMQWRRIAHIPHIYIGSMKL